MPVANSGKVRVSLPVKIQLDNFNYAEYGIVEGTVQNVSLVPQRDSYLVEIALNDGLNDLWQVNYLATRDARRGKYHHRRPPSHCAGVR